MPDDAYKDFKFRCDPPFAGITGDMYAEVVFGMDDAMSGGFAPVCERGEGFVLIWAEKSKAALVPTIIIHVSKG